MGLGIWSPIQHQKNQQKFNRLAWWEKQKQSITLKIPRNRVEEIHWEAELEFEWNGAWYDVVSWRITEHECIFQVIGDRKDTQLAEYKNKAIHRYIPKSKNLSKRTIVPFPILFIHRIFISIYFSNTLLDPFSFGNNNKHQDKSSIKKLLRPPIFIESF